MAQADFYLCERDLLEVGQLVFNDGGFVVPDIDYRTPDLLRISDLEELQRAYKEFKPQLFFIVSPKWERAPLTIHEIQKNGRKVFFISQKNGGPSIDIFCPRPLVINGRQAVAHGFIAYHRSFWNPFSNQMESTTQVLKDAYRALRAHLMRGGRKISRTNREVIVTKNTQNSGLELIDLKRNPQDETQLVAPAEWRKATEKSRAVGVIAKVGDHA